MSAFLSMPTLGRRMLAHVRLPLSAYDGSGARALGSRRPSPGIRAPGPGAPRSMYAYDGSADISKWQASLVCLYGIDG